MSKKTIPSKNNNLPKLVAKLSVVVTVVYIIGIPASDIIYRLSGSREDYLIHPTIYLTSFIPMLILGIISGTAIATITTKNLARVYASKIMISYVLLIILFVGIYCGLYAFASVSGNLNYRPLV